MKVVNLRSWYIIILVDIIKHRNIDIHGIQKNNVEIVKK